MISSRLKEKLEKANDDLLQKKARKKSLEDIAVKMQDLDSAMLEWSDEIWLTIIKEAIATRKRDIDIQV